MGLFTYSILNSIIEMLASDWDVQVTSFMEQGFWESSVHTSKQEETDWNNERIAYLHIQNSKAVTTVP